jgi:glycerol-3-phosphate dehydrogenase
VKRDIGALTTREHDLLVIGGGIHGAMVAWDAAQRGLSVALVEAADFGSGASWNSLKTVHGGMRHLQRADVAGLRESARERRALLRIAPDLVRPLPFLVPVYGHGTKGREALACALGLNDLLTWDRNRGLPSGQRIPKGRMLSPAEVMERVPGASRPRLTGGALWCDAQVASTERLLMGVLHAAADEGAVLANHVEARALLLHERRVTGVHASVSGDRAVVELRARMVVLAAGAGTAGLLATSGLRRPAVPLLRAMNLVLRRQLLAGCAVGAQAGGRFLFMVPWHDRSIVGTEYAPSEQEDRPQARAFLAEAARAFPWAELKPEDVGLVHTGLVPGVSSAAGLFSRSRLTDHAVEDGLAGLLSLLAVKYTTARGLAEATVDRALRHLGRPTTPSRTATTGLARARGLAGSLEEQALFAVHEEMALCLDDAVLRRLDLGTAGRPAPAAVQSVARVMARDLGWTAERQAREMEALEAYPAFQEAFAS